MRHRFFLTLAALALGTWAGSSALAAETTASEQRSIAESKMIFESRDLTGLKVYSGQDMKKKLGSLDNLLINAHTGDVMFGVLHTGIGGSYIAVPWNVLQIHKTANKDRYWLGLNKTEDDLANAPTFNKNHWPDFAANSPWIRSVDAFFGVRTVAKPMAMPGPGELSVNEMIFQSSVLSDLKVYNRNDQNKKLGSLDNLIINARTGHLWYGILDTGVGGKYIPVPWNAFQVEKAKNKNQYWLTLNKTEDDLANAPAFDKNRMSELTDSAWQQTVDRFFGVRTAGRSGQER